MAKEWTARNHCPSLDGMETNHNLSANYNLGLLSKGGSDSYTRHMKTKLGTKTELHSRGGSPRLNFRRNNQTMIEPRATTPTASEGRESPSRESSQSWLCTAPELAKGNQKPTNYVAVQDTDTDGHDHPSHQPRRRASKHDMKE